MNHTSPLRKDWKPISKDKADAPKPLEKFKTIKPVLSSKVGRELVQRVCGVSELLWIERWLENLMRTRSLPPSCMGSDAYNELMKVLPPTEMLMTMEQLRKQFLAEHPSHQPIMEDFSFLLGELEASHALQIQSLLSDHNNQKLRDDRL